MNISIIISDLSKNGNLDLLKILYINNNQCITEKCIENAIEFNKIDIVSWLIDINFEIKKKYLYHCIIYNNFNIFKILFLKKKFDVMIYAIVNKKYKYVVWMNKNGIDISVETIYIALFCNNLKFIDWIFTNSNINNIIFKSLIKKINDKKIRTIIKNYDLLSQIKDKEYCFQDINYFLENDDISDESYFIILGKHKYNYEILLACLLNTNIKTICDMQEIEGLQFDSYLILALNDMLYSKNRIDNIFVEEIQNFFITFEILNVSNILSEYKIAINSYINKNIANYVYSNNNFITDKNNLPNLINEPLIHESWEIALENNLYIYVNKKNYGFIIEELFEHWEYCLNLSYPKYPTNPYTNESVHPIEIYRIIIYSSLYKIQIPFIVNFFIKNPEFVISFYKQNINNINLYNITNYIINFFEENDLEYDEEINKWNLKLYNYFSYKYLYLTNSEISFETANLIFLFVYDLFL